MCVVCEKRQFPGPILSNVFAFDRLRLDMCMLLLVQHAARTVYGMNTISASVAGSLIVIVV
jgi:hypothetical protein